MKNYRDQGTGIRDRKTGIREQGSGIAGHIRAGVKGFVLTAACVLMAAAAVAQEKPWEKIPTPQLHAFKPHQPKRIELKNGIVLFLQEDHELPFVAGSVLIPGGSRDEQAARS